MWCRYLHIYDQYKLVTAAKFCLSSAVAFEVYRKEAWHKLWFSILLSLFVASTFAVLSNSNSNLYPWNHSCWVSDGHMVRPSRYYASPNNFTIWTDLLSTFRPPAEIIMVLFLKKKTLMNAPHMYPHHSTHHHSLLEQHNILSHVWWQNECQHFTQTAGYRVCKSNH